MPMKLGEHDQEAADLAWNESMISVIGTALRTADQHDEQLVASAVAMATHAAEYGGPLEEHAYRLSAVKVLYMAIEGLYGTSPGERDLAAAAQNEAAPVQAVLETALATYLHGLHELIKALTYPDDTPPELTAIVRAAIIAVRLRVAPMTDDKQRWRAAAEIMAKVGR
jgi:hypothetical protein